jgi:hypothetical protein
MGSEAICKATCKRKSASGKARLETDVLQFRGGDLKLTIPFKDMTSVTAKAGTLRIAFPGGVAAFELGAAAPKWADKILHPPSRLDKLGAKPEWRASAIAIQDEPFLSELRGRVAELVVGRAAKASDAIFLGAAEESDLAAIAKLKTFLKPNGALWIVRPKGRPEISEMAVMRAGKAAGLVDVKVISFSPTHTAEKFVIPVAARP